MFCNLFKTPAKAKTTKFMTDEEEKQQKIAKDVLSETTRIFFLMSFKRMKCQVKWNLLIKFIYYFNMKKLFTKGMELSCDTKSFLMVGGVSG